MVSFSTLSLFCCRCDWWYCPGIIGMYVFSIWFPSEMYVNDKLQGCIGDFCHRRYVLQSQVFLNIHSLACFLAATGFSEAFPGITPHLLTLASNFHMPFYRDIILAMGICSVSKRSCSNILKRGPGSAITIVVGGAAESLSARPGTADLTLRKRQVIPFPINEPNLIQCHHVQARFHQNCDSTWVRLCWHWCVRVLLIDYLRADLVPVFSFGENDVGHPVLWFELKGPNLVFSFADIRADAEWKRHNRICTPKKVPVGLWVYPSVVSWEGSTEL